MLKNDTLKNGTSRIGLYGSTPLGLKVTKFQLPPPKRLGTVVENILGGHHATPCQIGLN